jgi:hypothetical protein
VPPRPTQVDQSPLAVTSQGSLIVGLGYTHDLRSLAQVVELLRSGAVTGTIFVGVVLSGSKVKNALNQIDDAAAEVAATCQPMKARKGGQR